MSDMPITRGLLVRYGMIAVPLAFAGFPLYVLAPDFYATQHGLSLGLLGMMLLGIRLWDAVQDPFIGWLTDKSAGRFLPMVTLAMACLCAAITLLFNIDLFPSALFSPALWFGVCMFFAVTAYSIVTIVLGAQATLWTDSRNDQTRIAAAREGFALAGLIIAVSAPSVLQEIVPQGQVYIWYSLILCALACMGLLLFSMLLKKIPPRGVALKTASLFTALRALPPPTLRLFAVYALSMLASSVPAVLVIFFVRDLLGAGDMVGLFLLLYFLSGMAGMPVWKKISVRFGKHKAWAASNVLAVGGFVGAFFLGQGDITAYALVCLISGLALGADLTLPPSILASQIHSNGNLHLSGTYYAFLAFIAKASLALASALALPYLDYAGFVPQAENTAGALMALSSAYALVPCLLKLLAAVLLYYFFIAPFSGGRHETAQDNSREIAQDIPRNHRSHRHA